jgi:hypothetical protein
MYTRLSVATAALGLVFAAAGVGHGSVGIPIASGDTVSGSRSSGSGGGIYATNGWGSGGFVLSWQITNQGSSSFPYLYTYTITGAGTGDLLKGLSHWILQISDTAAASDFTDFTIAGEFDQWGDQGNSNPGIPAPLWGIKFAGNGALSQTVSFRSTKSPMWGDFYAGDGTDRLPSGDSVWVYAYNTAFGNPPNDTSDYVDWVAVPDTDGGYGDIVPEPASLLVWCLLSLAGCFGLRRLTKGRSERV